MTLPSPLVRLGLRPSPTRASSMGFRVARTLIRLRSINASRLSAPEVQLRCSHFAKCFSNRGAKFSGVSDQNSGENLIPLEADRDVNRYALDRSIDAPIAKKHPPFRKKGPNNFEVIRVL
jgi:hypothetical protein